jgi:putative hydroxymethylpyrimidine transport system substrate-binding protein
MLTRSLRGRGALLAASLISLAALAGCGELHTRTGSGPARNLVVALDSQPSALFAPIYEAQANGDFGRGGLNVTIAGPSAAQTPLGALETNRASLAVVSEPTLLAARDSGAQLVAVGALVQGPLESIISTGRKPITSVSQLVGRTIATSGSGLAEAELASVLSTADVDPSQVHAITVAGNLDAALTSHKAAAELGGFWDYDALQLAAAHQHPSVIRLPAAGIPSFSELVIVVRTGEAHHDGPLLRAFLQSLDSGESAVTADPQGVARLLAGINPALSQGFELAVLRATAPITQPADKADPFGFQNPLVWRRFADWMRVHGLLNGAGDGALAITDEFLPGQGE